MKKKHWLVLAAATALAAMSGTAWATGTIASIVAADGTINGCYRANVDGGQGQLRVVTAGEQCKNNELAIQWSQQGPKGDRGIQGIQGPQGPAGAALVGSSCSIPSGGNGTIQMAIASSGAISFTCLVSGGSGGGGTSQCPDPPPDYPNAVTTCNPTTGVVGLSCDSGFANADGSITNGCETSLNTNGNCGSVGHAVPPPGTNHANWVCANGVVQISSCVPTYYDANAVPFDGCEFQHDQFEENDTPAAVRALNPVGPGSIRTIQANLTPSDDDWYTFTTPGCSVLAPCHVGVHYQGSPTSLFEVRRDDGSLLAPGAIDTLINNRTYTVQVAAGQTYLGYQLTIIG